MDAYRRVEIDLEVSDNFLHCRSRGGSDAVVVFEGCEDMSLLDEFSSAPLDASSHFGCFKELPLAVVTEVELETVTTGFVGCSSFQLCGVDVVFDVDPHLE